ncbi:HTH-type transcriptional regulator PuuR [Fusobacterium sp. DD29]|nr:HTH-type transcriptional regulator PuuR [Fusobacterium sp. DD45]MBR8710187.1 HTH-type transcriptional regulator PuuR [Fusobacterium sp. DD28]MBR8748744.1 HTH-type transcriptional regulator PuuR [Fusobacterium sp. DD29]MBR8750712.1 HTH-type transcriptional regulator PuuR [Fusobacterium sp. DD26]MBR8761011.1 HTH-type transcriptional regulator PuuR [Fusobacterium sp. DD25]MBR8767023.1 HTH-type transcriptional regulator PuuR [Fusobacterium sp. DD43]MBR8771016.1 HTH-type transcriptional regulat
MYERIAMSMGVEINIGKRVKSVRLAKGILLKDLAKECGISSSMLSQIEKGNANPSLNTIKTIAKALEIPMFKFFIEPEMSLYSANVLKKEDRKVILDEGVIYEVLTPEGTKKLECMKMVLSKKNSESSKKPLSHEGEEVALVLSGKVKITIGEEDCEMLEGDSIQIPALIPHKWTNIHEKESVVVYTVTPPGS